MQRPCPCSSKISIFSSFWASIAYFFITIYISYFIFFSCLHVINTAEGEFACLLSDSFYHKPEKSDGRVAGTDEDIVLFTTKAKLKVSQSSITVICFLVIVPFVFFFFVFEDILFTELSCYFSISMQAAAWRSNDSGMFANSFCYIPKMCKNFAVFLVARREECS